MDVVKIKTPSMSNMTVERKEKESEDGDSGRQERLKWIEDRVLSALRQHVKQDKGKLQQQLNSSESVAIVSEFLENPENKCLYILLASDRLKLCVDVPQSISSYWKVLYILKTGLNKSILETKRNMNRESPAFDLLFGELAQEPLEHLEKLVQEIYMPLICNPANQSGIGEVQAKEIQEMLHTFLASISITLGQTQGKTCLPLPVVDIGGQVSSKDKIHLLEGAVISWTKQIKRILKQDPENLLKLGLDPTPEKEIEFWRSKAENLNSIFSQLQGGYMQYILFVSFESCCLTNM